MFIDATLRRSLAVIVVCFLFIITARAVADDVAMSRFGINDHIHRYTDWDAECDEIIASGIKWVRIFPEWGSIEPAPPNPDPQYNTAYLEKLDGIVNKLVAHDVNILFVLCYTAPWASQYPSHPDATRYPPASWTTWEDYVSFITKHYRNKVYYWEVWNEPDHSGFWKQGPEEYAELLQHAATKIRQTSSLNRVVMGGLACQTYGVGTFFDEMLTVPGTAETFDIACYHAYGDMAEHRRRYDGMMAVLNKHGLGGRKLWISEVGYSSSGNTALEAMKADYQDQSYLGSFNFPNVERIFGFTHRNQVVKKPDGTINAVESNFGLIGQILLPQEAVDRTPLPALYYYQAAAAAQADPILQNLFPAQAESRRTLYQVPAASGDGSHSVSYLNVPSGGYIYYRVDDSWMHNDNETILADITYRDLGGGNLTLAYDKAGSGAADYTAVTISRGNTGNVVTTPVTLANAQFANSQNNFADLRISGSGGAQIVSVKVRRPSGVGGTQSLRHVQAATGDGSSVTQQHYIPSNTYMYFRVNDHWLYDANSLLDIRADLDVTYLDNGGTMRLGYDGQANPYTQISFTKSNTGLWKTHSFPLSGLKFGNRQNWDADLRLLAGGGQDLIVSRIALRKEMTKGRIVLRPTDRFRFLQRPDSADPAHEHYNPVATVAGRSCRRIGGNNKYINIKVSDALVPPGHPSVRIGLSFYDPGTGGVIGIHYNATGGVNYKNYSIPKNTGGTPQWRWVSFVLNDADFRNAQALGNSDFRIHNGFDGSEEHVEQVDVELVP